MRKFAIMVLVVFGLVSVSMGANIPKSDEENYQKLKAEMEEVEQSGNWDRIGATCSWGEDGKVAVIGNSNLSHLYGIKGKEWCHLKNVLAFFDEIRAMEVKTKNRLDSSFRIAIAKVREIPRFKEDDNIYISVRGNYKNQAVFNDYAFWKRVFEKWEELKMELEISKYMN